MSTQTQTTQTTTTQKPKGLKMKEHVAFQSTIETNLTTTQELCGVINSFFRPALADYEGCFIVINPTNGALGLNLYFKDKGDPGEGQIKCLGKRGSTNDSASITEKLNIINSSLSKKRIFDLTSEAKEALENFFDGQVNWGQVVFENTANVNNYGSQYNVIFGVTNLSVTKVLREIYGDTDENGKPIQYDTKIMRPTSSDPHNFIISILKLNNDVLQKFSTKIGMINNPVYNFPIIPAV